MSQQPSIRGALTTRVAAIVAGMEPGALRPRLAAANDSMVTNSHGPLDAATRSVLRRVIRQAEERRFAAEHFYNLLEVITSRNGLFRFGDFSEIADLPQRGLYLIFDPAEPAAFSTALPRLVRVGTHGVAVGSKSNLRTRLRAHFGQRDGTGNHRASIFRLHVGTAILHREGSLDAFPDWGRGMSADAQTRSGEEPLERAVSEYISRLEFTYLDIADASSPKSMRAVLERALINFLTADLVPLERSSKHWLGNWSPITTIRDSGMWNIQHVGGKYDVHALAYLQKLVDNPTFSGI